jgi:hypothetical protein
MAGPVTFGPVVKQNIMATGKCSRGGHSPNGTKEGGRRRRREGERETWMKGPGFQHSLQGHIHNDLIFLH